MSYKRLTIKDEEYGNYVENKGSELNKPKVAVSFNGKIHGEIIDRLAELEDKIEQRKMLELPCMIQNNDGEWRVYFFNTMVYEIDCYKYDDIDKEDAEATLKALKGEV